MIRSKTFKLRIYTKRGYPGIKLRIPLAPAYDMQRMDNIMRKIINRIKDENGAVQIVEASFVFPIMFFILIFLLYMGNAFYAKAQVESVVQTYAIEGANKCADPLLELIENNQLPSLNQIDIQPYRYVFGSMNSVEKEISTKVIETISGKSTTFYKGMKAQLGSKSNIAKYTNYVVYSTFAVEVKYSITFPIRFMGTEPPVILQLTSRAEVPVNDTTEFIRNTDMVLDLFYGSQLANKISDTFSKINDFISSFAQK